MIFALPPGQVISPLPVARPVPGANNIVPFNRPSSEPSITTVKPSDIRDIPQLADPVFKPRPLPRNPVTHFFRSAAKILLLFKLFPETPFEPTPPFPITKRGVLYRVTFSWNSGVPYDPGIKTREVDAYGPISGIRQPQQQQGILSIELKAHGVQSLEFKSHPVWEQIIFEGFSDNFHEMKPHILKIKPLDEVASPEAPEAPPEAPGTPPPNVHPEAPPFPDNLPIPDTPPPLPTPKLPPGKDDGNNIVPYKRPGKPQEPEAPPSPPEPEAPPPTKQF